MKTFIKWSGNKTRYIKFILPHFPTEFDKYIEPFIGSGAVFLNLQPNKWIINDINRDLYNMWRCIQQDHLIILNNVSIFKDKFMRLNKRDKLLFCRSLTNKLSCLPFECHRASLFLLLKYCVYMGILLRHKEYYFRGFDMSLHKDFGKMYPFTDGFKDNIDMVSNYLKTSKGKITNNDYRKCLLAAKNNDFVFLDPPYIEDHKYDFKYNIDETSLSMDFLFELAEEVKKLDKKEVKWLMTQADTKYVRELFQEYNIIKYPVYRRQSNSYKYELIIKNY